MKSKLILAAGSLAVASSLLLNACSKPATTLTGATAGASGSTSELTTVRLGLMANSDGAYVAAIAQEEGYFKKYGINVQTTTVSAGIDTVNSIAMNQLDIGYVADFAALNRFGASAQSDLRIFSKLSSSGSSANKLYVAKNINSLSDLKGKGFVTHKGTVVEYWDARTLEKAGLKQSDVTLVPVSSGQESYAVMVSGQASAVWASGQDAQKLEQTGKFKVLAVQSDIIAPTIAFAISTKSYLSKNKKSAEAYLKAYNDGIKLIQSDPDKAAGIVNKTLNIPKDTVLAGFKSTNYEVGFKQSDYDALSGIYTWLKDSSLLKNTYDLHTYIDTTALKEAFPKAVSYK